MDIKTVTVIGANGTMGCNVSGIFASFGNCKVYMVCRDIISAEAAAIKATKSVKAEAIKVNLIPKSYCDLEECITDSDLIFESVAENLEIKKDVYLKILEFIKPNTIISTGTSGLSINELSECFPIELRSQYVGIHMYNPPYNMSLCEVIPSRVTNETMLNELKLYLKDILNRKVVEVKDAPAFLGNRIGFYFINEALRYADLYKDNGGVDYIDAILGPFTGRSMAPLVTSDFVGLDVHKAIVDNLYYNSKDYARSSFEMPDFATNLIKDNKLGRKSGIGLYKIERQVDGKKSIYVYDVLSDNYRPKEDYVFTFAKNMVRELRIGNYNNAFAVLLNNHSIEAQICTEFLIKYVLYGITAAKEIGESVHSCDDVMASGFDWAPPLSVIEAFGGVYEFKKLAYKHLGNQLEGSFDLNILLEDIPSSNYDYRPFFKAK
ncbi:3-hydroxyacyl-CoA dehydrogenase family protein [Paenibacillus sp. FSL H8-0332]|uniref:3-hydroxyacyl-CoA dehydrogenase family protein n=1 Tax=Paenibacillus sp. FSL H8-0332 TaxID=2954742 RepID=UPI0030D4A682